MNYIQVVLEEFDETFGKMKDGVGYGEESSIGISAGCDDCFTNQRERAKHRKFLEGKLTTLIKRQKSEIGELETIELIKPYYNDIKPTYSSLNQTTEKPEKYVKLDQVLSLKSLQK